MKKAIVFGAGGFIGSHLVTALRQRNFWVKGVDLKYPDFSVTTADEFVIGDLRNPRFVQQVLDFPYDEVYQLAADMGGAGFIFTGENDADVMHNSATINLNMLHYGSKIGVKKIFYSSSACIYPEFNQSNPDRPLCTEDSAYPAQPDSEYGWEKLFSERLYFAFKRNYNLNVKIARFHNIFGEEGTFEGGREKAPAAICRKIAQAKDGEQIEIWGDGLQTRSFLYIHECIEGIFKLMASNDFDGPVNIGSDEMVTINELANIVINISGKQLSLKHIDGPLGVRGRNSENTLIYEKLNWKPSKKLADGLKVTYQWINEQVQKGNLEVKRSQEHVQN